MAITYGSGFAVTIGGVATNPLQGSLVIHRSLTEPSRMSFQLRDTRQALSHVQHGATAVVTDVATSATVFSGHVLRPRVTSRGAGDLVTIAVKAAGIERVPYRTLLTATQARSINTAADATAQLDAIVTVLGSDFSAGTVDANINKVIGTQAGLSVGQVLRRFGDAQYIAPDGEIDLIERAALSAATTIDEEHVAASSRYSADLATAVGRVIAYGASIKFIVGNATLALDADDLAVATFTPPSNTEVVRVERMFARQTISGKFDSGDELDGIWDPDKQHVEWSGTLSSGQTATVEIHGVWRTERVVTATNPSALAGDQVIEVPVTGTADIAAAADRALTEGQDPIELLTLDVVFASELATLEPGDAVKVSLDLQRKLDVFDPMADDLWLVHTLRLFQPGSSTGLVTLGLSRRLPDYRTRDQWTSPHMAVLDYEGRQIVTGSGGGAPQIAQVLPAVSRTVAAGAFTVDLGDYFSDPDGDTLTYTASSGDTGVATVAVSGSTLTVTPVDEGDTSITVTASDATRSAAQLFALSLVANRAPTTSGTIPDAEIAKLDHVVDVASYFSDPDGDTLSYSASSDDTGVATVAVSGSEVTVSRVAAGTATITVTASDGDLDTDLTFEVTVLTIATYTGAPSFTVFSNGTLHRISYTNTDLRDLTGFMSPNSAMHTLTLGHGTNSSVNTRYGSGTTVGGSFEEGAKTFTLEAPTVTAVELPGPDHPDNVTRDGLNVYNFRHGSADQAKLRDWIIAANALTPAQQAQISVTLAK